MLHNLDVHQFYEQHLEGEIYYFVVYTLFTYEFVRGQGYFGACMPLMSTFIMYIFNHLLLFF